MAELKDFGTVKTWYEAYKSVKEAEDKKPEDEKEDEKKKKSPVEVLPKDGGDEEQEEKKEEKPDQSGEVEKLKAEIEKLKGELQKKDLEVKKKDAETTVEPNPDTGEIPLRVGIAQSILDKKKKAEKKNGKDVKEELEEVNTKDGTMTSSQLDRLKQSYSTVGNTIDPEKAMALSKMLNRFGEGELRQLVRKDIKFVSTLAVNKLIMKHNYKAKDIHDIRRKK